MSQTSKIIDKVEANVIHTYNRYQVALEKGDGVYLYDAEGKKYLDFGSGIGVFADIFDIFYRRRRRCI